MDFSSFREIMQIVGLILFEQLYIYSVRCVYQTQLISNGKLNEMVFSKSPLKLGGFPMVGRERLKFFMSTKGHTSNSFFVIKKAPLLQGF